MRTLLAAVTPLGPLGSVLACVGYLTAVVGAVELGGWLHLQGLRAQVALWGRHTSDGDPDRAGPGGTGDVRSEARTSQAPTDPHPTGSPAHGSDLQLEVAGGH